jgi:hypothetical protein
MLFMNPPFDKDVFKEFDEVLFKLHVKQSVHTDRN